jgi:hypothetical protein
MILPNLTNSSSQYPTFLHNIKNVISTKLMMIIIKNNRVILLRVTLDTRPDNFFLEVRQLFRPPYLDTIQVHGYNVKGEW